MNQKVSPAPPNGAQLSPLDLISAWMDRPDRPLDFGQILELRKTAPSAADLRRGAHSARRAFAQSGSVLSGEQWMFRPDDAFGVEEWSDEQGLLAAAEAFYLKPFDIGVQNPVQQLLLEASGRRVLLTRMHHALADGLGCLKWVAHQFSVASGLESPETSPRFVEQPVMRRAPKSVRKTTASHRGSSRRLWVSGTKNSPKRRWKTLEIDADAWRHRLASTASFRYNDVLCGMAMEAMVRWNESHSAPISKLGLWHPINIREQAFEGFGNGSSRVRLYRESGGSLKQCCESMRNQMDWARNHGEWHIPESALFSWPTWLKRPILCSVLDRPWVDMGSMLFSHMEKQGQEGDLLMSHCTQMEWLGMLDKRFASGMVGATYGGKTWMTLCWDTALWTDSEAHGFLALYEELLGELAAEWDA